MPSDHDIFRLDDPISNGVVCPRCKGIGDDPDHAYICDLCEGEQDVPSILAGMYKSEMKE